MAVFIDALAAQNIRPRIFVSNKNTLTQNIDIFCQNMNTLTQNIDIFCKNMNTLTQNIDIFLSKYEYFLPKDDPGMVAENHHKHEKYKR